MQTILRFFSKPYHGRVFFTRKTVKLFAPLSSFAILAAFQTFVRAYGWKLLVSFVPAAEPYWNVADKTLSILTALAGLWLANVVVVMILDKTFSKVMRSNPLAKKLLPLLKYAATVLLWGF